MQTQLRKRLSSYDEDKHHWNEYDYILINDNLENCFSQIEKIIEKELNKFNLP